jgi:hypothetical protein
MFQQNFQPVPYIIRGFHFSLLTFNSTLPLKKYAIKRLIWAQKSQIVQNKNSKTKVKITKKIHCSNLR